MNRHTAVARTLLASAAIALAIALGGCETDGLNPAMTARAMKPLSPEMVALIEQKNMPKESPILVRIFKEEAEMEIWKQDASGQFAPLKTYPICRWSGELGPKIKEGDRQAPEGFYTITPGTDESELELLSFLQPWLSQRLRQSERAHRRVPDGARRLLLGRLLRHDRRADGRNLRARPRIVLRRPEIVPSAGLSVPHDAAQPRQASQQPAHGVLADDQARQRPLRSDPAAAEGGRLRQALRVRRSCTRRIDPAAQFQCQAASARPIKCRKRSPPR